MVESLLAVYLIVQVLTLAVLPLAVRLFANLADRGYALAKSLGILLGGFTLWIGVSYGLLRNETGGAWLALLLVAGVSWFVGWPQLRQLFASRDRGEASPLPAWPYILVVELLFLLAFLVWAYVRAHDAAANHTEQPMDLMFMNSIWFSPTYPPQDAWFAGYAISYYYFGYWLLTNLGRLAGQPPEIIYVLGQAVWYALLLLGSFGVGYNLLARKPQTSDDPASGAASVSALLGGLLAAVAVGITGNLQGMMEWLYANGAPVAELAKKLGVYNFPEGATVTNLWHIGSDWWWWRSSRVIEDLDLLGGHIEIIDEFPIFSYVLGDNHPHVLAMPFVLLVIALGLNLFLQPTPAASADKPTSRSLWSQLMAAIPMGFGGLLLMTVATGALIFLNTWDFPPYWLLLTLVMFGALLRFPGQDGGRFGRALLGALFFAALLLVGTLLIYLPYFLTAQSQAGGIVPNFFNPTRLQQFLLMFAFAITALVALIILGWQERGPTRGQLLASFAAVYGLPLLFLATTMTLALGSAAGQRFLSGVVLPEGATSYLPSIVERWGSQFWTFLLLGALLALVVALLWRRWVAVVDDRAAASEGDSPFTFYALLLALVGLLLLYAPEFVYLRDNFGTRMNTVFKFYYQGWLLLGLSSAYAIVTSFRQLSQRRLSAQWATQLPALLLSGAALLLIGLGLVYPVTAAYSKAGGFAGEPTFDATAYIARENPAEAAALAWVRANTAPDSRVLEGKGRSYWATYNRVSTTTGRPTLLGWDGHQAQWRGKAYGEMAHMRPEALQAIYGEASIADLGSLLTEWQIDYVYIGPTERREYEMTPRVQERLAAVMDLVFDQDGVQIYRRREP